MEDKWIDMGNNKNSSLSLKLNIFPERIYHHHQFLASHAVLDKSGGGLLWLLKKKIVKGHKTTT